VPSIGNAAAHRTKRSNAQQGTAAACGILGFAHAHGAREPQAIGIEAAWPSGLHPTSIQCHAWMCRASTQLPLVGDRNLPAV
jgi:hypothetical protein